MKKWFRKALVFCERCGEVCDTTCRLESARERALVAGLVGRSWLR